MGQAYKIDRLNLITHKGQKKKSVDSLRCRYIAKSHVVNCTAQSQRFDFVNLRGSCFTKTNFNDTVFYGCDFWGTSFNNCSFQNAQFRDCVFMACKFKDCNFTGTEFSYTTIVNTSLSECLNIGSSSGVRIFNVYPKCDISESLADALLKLKDNKILKKNKLLFISETKYNHLNLFLLQERYKGSLPDLLSKLEACSSKGITTYKKLERVLNKLQKDDIISPSCPTQSRGCVANET